MFHGRFARLFTKKFICSSEYLDEVPNKEVFTQRVVHTDMNKPRSRIQ